MKVPTFVYIIQNLQLTLRTFKILHSIIPKTHTATHWLPNATLMASLYILHVTL